METLYLILVFFLSIALIGLLIVKTGERNARIAKFDLMYENFKVMLYDPLRPINRTSWKHLNKCFDELELLYKVNPEKVDVLRGEFLKLYEPVTDEIDLEFREMNSENEFSPEQIFSEFNHI